MDIGKTEEERLVVTVDPNKFLICLNNLGFTDD